MTINKAFFIAISILLLIGVIYLFAKAPSELIHTNEARAWGHLQIIGSEEIQKQIWVKKYLPLNELGQGDKSIPRPGQEVGGYRFDVRVNAGGRSFEAVAVPAEYGKTGRLSFYVDESGKMRGADKAGAEATADDPELR
jgi:hypothetical protein